MLNDVKCREMMDRCLQVIRELNIEADILTLSNLQFADD